MLYQRRAILRAEQSWDNPDTPEKLDPAKISSVQYVKRQLDEVQRRLLAQEGTVVRMVIDHPHYIAQAVLTAETLSAIMPDPE